MAKPKKPRGKRKAQTFPFTLHNLDVEDILSQYHEQNDSSSEDAIEESIVNLEEDEIGLSSILHEKDRLSKRATYVLDSFKGNVKYWVNMIDNAQGDALPRYTNKPCWWCRSTFKSHPIGCPLKYYPNIKSDTQEKERIEEHFKDANLPIDCGNDYFETDGIFCTFPCAKAYAIDEMKNFRVKFNNSLTLLTQMHFKIFKEIVVIPTAGSWKLLQDYWGHLTAQEFRAASGLIEYTETINMARPLMYSSGVYIKEKRIKL